MKELLEELELEHLPTLNDFREMTKGWNIIMRASAIDEFGDFISQSLTKGMFVPCNEKNEITSECETITLCDENGEYNEDIPNKAFSDAKERVVFKDKTIVQAVQYDYLYNTIEDAIIAGIKLKLK